MKWTVTWYKNGAMLAVNLYPLLRIELDSIVKLFYGEKTQKKRNIIVIVFILLRES